MICALCETLRGPVEQTATGAPFSLCPPLQFCADASGRMGARQVFRSWSSETTYVRVRYHRACVPNAQRGFICMFYRCTPLVQRRSPGAQPLSLRRVDHLGLGTCLPLRAGLARDSGVAQSLMRVCCAREDERAIPAIRRDTKLTWCLEIAVEGDAGTDKIDETSWSIRLTQDR